MIFKCKMCGGTLDVKEGQSIAECEFCGTKQTIPVIDNEKSFNLHNRANALRLRNEFDKAIIVYENILTDNPDDAEAHWGLLLCKYGIEYVDDPLTGKKIPTCHRTQFDSVFSDPDYKAAIKNADVLAREVYETEAKEIDGIQKHILEISQKEERFDVFICYKESDENGRRTIDSVIAQDLYSALTQKGYKVFFSKITLETKLGEMYEPYIFAALNSAKVMLVIGTKEAYFNAVWVRNEWSRFIKIMERDHDKYLIPCYKDMDAYDLPMEMASFQAQDMGKIGFLQDLLYGIDKLFGKTARPVKVEEKPTAVIQNGVNYSALLERAQILIEDGDTKKADSLLEKVLNNDPKNAKAYFYKLLIDLNVKSAEELNNFTRRISDEPNYIKACRYADAAMKAELDGYSSRIEENIKRQKQEEEYDRCVTLCHFTNEKYALEAANGFQKLGDYKDSRAYYERCVARLEKAYDEAVNYIKNYNYSDAACLLEDIKGYKDSVQLIENCCALRNKEAVYRSAVSLARYDSVNSLSAAIERLKTIGDYRDSATIIEKYNQRINKIKQREEISKKRKTRFVKIASPIVAAIIIALIFLTVYLFVPLTKYNKAEKAYKNGNYDTAIALYDDLYRNHHDFKNAASKIKSTKYKKADTLVKAGKYDEAEDIFAALGNYKNSADRLNLTKASECFSNGDYLSAINFVTAAGGVVYVNFETVGGNKLSNLIISKSDGYNIPPAEKVGYTFYKWELISWIINDASDIYKTNITLEAVYTVDAYTITYNCGNGQNNSSNRTKYTISNYPIKLKDAFDINADFVGWTLNDEIITEIPAGTIGDLTLTAVWKPYDVKLEYNATKTGYTIIGLNTTNKVIDIKQFYKGKPVTQIASKAFYNYSAITSITIPDSVLSIGEQAFSGCTGLTNLILGNGIKSIGANAFNGCNGLSIVTIPDSVDSIGEGAFKGCDNLNSITLPFIGASKTANSGYDQVFGYIFGYTISSSENVSGLTNQYTSHDVQYYYYIPSAIETVVISDKAEYISDYAFNGCEELTDVIIGNGVSIIGTYAFGDCIGLREIVVPNSVESISKAAFRGCDRLISITLPFVGASRTANSGYDQVFGYIFGYYIVTPTQGTQDTVQYETSSAWYCYYIPDSIESVTLSDGVVSIGKSAFRECHSLTTIRIPDSVISIGSFAFYKCYNLTSITLPFIGASRTANNGYDNMFGYIFGCYKNATLPDKYATYQYYYSNSDEYYYIYPIPTKLKTVVISEGITEVSGFEKCGDIETVVIPNSVTHISYDAFKDCIGLKSISMPDSVIFIGGSAFDGCSNLNAITLPSSMNNIASYVFRNCKSLKSITIPNGILSIGESAFYGCIDLSNINIGCGVESIGSAAFYNCKNLKSVTIPNNVLSIGDSVFRECVELTNITIGTGVESIGDAAFYNCKNLKSVTIPNNVLSIGDSAFYGCIELTNITIGNGVKSIGINTFYNCENLTSIIIPDNVTSIGTSAFGGCYKLKTIVVSSGLNTIGRYAFHGCDELETLLYVGTSEQWDEISIDIYNEMFVNAIRYYYSESEPALNSTGTAYDGNYWHYDTDGITPKIWNKGV